MKSLDALKKLLPAPKALEVLEGTFTLNANTPIKANFKRAESLKYLLGLCGLKSKPITTGAPEAMDQHLLLGIGDVQLDGNDLSPTFPGQDAYAMRISPAGIGISARTVCGLASGLKTLAKLATACDTIACAEIQDAPTLDFRGLHLCIFNPDDGTEKEDTDPQSIRKMLLMAAMAGYKYVMFEYWGMFPYQRRDYAVWPNDVYTPEVVKELIRYTMDDLHMIALPCQNLVSHAGWSRISSRKHVVLDQRPDLSDMWIPGGWCFATENPDTKAYLCDIMEELLEAYRNPPFLHASCDKAFGFGSTEADRTKSADLLYGNHISFLNSFLQERGTRMIMWADMLYTSMDALYWKTNPAITDMLPRNILMNIWTHNDPGQHWPDVDFFQSRGFQVIYSPFMDLQSVRSMTDVCMQHHSYGLLQTTWHKPRSSRTAAVYSGAIQWTGKKMNENKISPFIEQWYGAY